MTDRDRVDSVLIDLKYDIVISWFIDEVFFVFCRDFIDYLHSLNKKIYLISGGFHSLIDPVSIELEIGLRELNWRENLFLGLSGTWDSFKQFICKQAVVWLQRKLCWIWHKSANQVRILTEFQHF